MSLETDVRLMASTRPFDLMPREAVQIIAFSCTKANLKAGETLFEPGAPADAAFFVLSGALQLTADNAERRVEAGSLIGETALMADVVRRVGARAAEDCELLRVPSAVFRRVLSEFPGVAGKVRKAASARTRGLVKQLDAVRERLFEA
jgi:CRP-like cAMP-binding protein